MRYPGTVVRLVFFVAVFPLWGCTKETSPSDSESHRLEIEQWRRARFTRLTAEDGWLTLCGLWWLQEGENSTGTDSSNSFILPKGKAPSRVGSFFLRKNAVRFVAQKGSEITHGDSVVTTIELRTDHDADPTILRLKTLRMLVIERGGKLAVRVKDSENPARTHFKGLEYFPIDPRWRVEARLKPYVPPKQLRIPTMASTTEEYLCPGELKFTFDDSTYHVDALIEAGSEDKLFIMFSDETNGSETYGAGRQMYADLPDSNGKVVLDFNKAYNWPCVFTEYATCPLIPEQNVIPLRVEAGEKMYTGHE